MNNCIPAPKMPICAKYHRLCTPARHVAAGAAWLDIAFPSWERKVDVSMLNLRDPQQCICGQVVPMESLAPLMTTGSGYGEAAFFFEVTHGLVGADTHLGFMRAEDQDQSVTLIKARFDSGILSDTV